ncbi:MAG: antibiotic biosynthesis monooxygenase [Sandaracinus sp.]|nr:antibiotic biosynthesis monooxygenase [Sandaracinus sp.]MCB9617603.1 antibiotic biosynthesis monooxygenase [Sandaracinus sp.]MCB9619850.1 antibiotic biosynthesis monooxygenase [Sandaracinus sp.]MCB9622839.1 antibiotic biosynthesis monooxygenase [Sandaracinus sp.]
MAVTLVGACDDTPEERDSEPVIELAVRRLDDGQDIAEFEAARDAFVARLRERDGVEVDRELRAFFDFGSQAAPTAPVFVGMTQYATSEAFGAAGEALGSSPEAAAFFATFTPEAFTALRPLDAAQPVDLAAIADQPGQVLEIAVRDLSAYEGFDQAAYEAARDGFLALLRDQPGFVAEYQWVSVLDPNTVVGMTVYESQEAFFGVLGNERFVDDPATAAFLFGYPPATAYVSSVVR